MNVIKRVYKKVQPTGTIQEHESQIRLLKENI